jgi:hypothetical protein
LEKKGKYRKYHRSDKDKYQDRSDDFREGEYRKNSTLREEPAEIYHDCVKNLGIPPRVRGLDEDVATYERVDSTSYRRV